MLEEEALSFGLGRGEGGRMRPPPTPPVPLPEWGASPAAEEDELEEVGGSSWRMRKLRLSAPSVTEQPSRGSWTAGMKGLEHRIHRNIESDEKRSDGRIGVVTSIVGRDSSHRPSGADAEIGVILIDGFECWEKMKVKFWSRCMMSCNLCNGCPIRRQHKDGTHQG